MKTRKRLGIPKQDVLFLHNIMQKIKKDEKARDRKQLERFEAKARNKPTLDEVVEKLSGDMAKMVSEITRVKKYVPEYIESTRIKRLFYSNGKDLAKITQDVFLRKEIETH